MRWESLSLLGTFLTLASIKLNAQNLVPNPGFEIISSCPQNLAQINLAPPWYTPTAGTPELFNVCSPPNQYGVHVPKNVIGYQNAHSGSGYAGVGTGPFNQPVTIREYISTRLSDSLDAGKEYCVEFYISLGDSSIWGMDRLAVCFVNDSIKDMSVNYLYYLTPQIETDSGFVYNDTNAWVKISGTFIAQGGEKYIILGNFRSDSVTTRDSLPAGTWYTAYYYIDDVSVYLCEDTIAIPAEITLTPSPSNGIVQLKGNFPGGAELILYDMLGQSVGVISIEDGVCDRTLFLPFASGIYLYRIESEDMLLQSGKLLIQK